MSGEQCTATIASLYDVGGGIRQMLIDLQAEARARDRLPSR